MITPNVVALLDIHWSLGYPDSDKNYTINLGDYILEELKQEELVQLVTEELKTFGLTEIKLDYFFNHKKMHLEAVSENIYSRTEVNVAIEGYQALKVGNRYFKLDELEVEVN